MSVWHNRSMQANVNTPTHGWVHHLPGIDNPAFGRTYPLSVYTPPGYGESDRRYPVAYVFDGQNLYFDGGTHAGGWHVHEALDRQAAQGRTVPVVIGIHSGGDTRIQELSPFPFWGQQGRGDAFLDWVVGPLSDYVRREFHVLSGPEQTMIGGASLGGLLALYAFFRHPDVFGKAMALSPSLVMEPDEFTRLSPPSAWSGCRRLFIEAGRHEPRLMDGAGRFADHLQSLGFRQGADLLWVPDHEGHHHESTWRWHVPNAMQYLYE